jgi:hypothetical protein
MTSSAMQGLIERRRELTTRRMYAERNYIFHDGEAQKFMRVMAKADNDLMVLQFEIQKAQVLDAMQASDAVGEKKWF